jgi:gamma-glutamyltranspeptidase / glutathione hydrolase
MNTGTRRRLVTFVALLSQLWSGCGTRATPPPDGPFSPQRWPQDERDRYLALQIGYDLALHTRVEPAKAATSAKAMIAGTSEPFAVHAGLDVLRRGGSAADAALTTAITQVALTAGAMISYAGIMTVVYYDASSDTVHTLNAGYNTLRDEKAPLEIPAIGTPSGRSALVPGFMAGVQALHDRFGRIPFAALFDPAIWVADQGAFVSPTVAALLSAHQKFITRRRETRRILTKRDGTLYRSGEVLRQRALAATLSQIASEGSRYMYTGEWAHRFVAALRKEGSSITLDDLAAYRPLWTEPLRMPYRGYELVSLGAPNFGGTQTLANLKLVDVADVNARGHYAKSPEALYELIQISRFQTLLANVPTPALRTYFPDLDPSLAARLSPETAERALTYIQRPNWWNDTVSKAAPAAPSHSAGVVAIDEQGNAAALLQSCNCLAWGSTGIFVDGISIPDSASHQQARVAQAGPGARLPDGTNPLLVLKGGKPVLASSAVGTTLHDVTVQNLINVLDFGMSPRVAVETPNTLGPFYDMDITGPKSPEVEKETFGEGEFPDWVLDRLRARGQPIQLTRGDQQRAYWIGIRIDPGTRARTGGVTSRLSALVEGY